MLTKEEFAQKYSQFLQTQNSHLIINIEDELNLRIELDDREISIFLNNAYDEYLNKPDNIDEIIEHYCSATLSSTISESKNKINVASIIPIIRHSDYLQNTLEIMDSSGADIAKSRLFFERLNTELIVLYAEVRDEKLGFLSEEDVSCLALSQKSLREKSIENLKTILPPIELAGNDDVYIVSAGGSFESSLILLDSFWKNDNFKVEGNIVVALPARDWILITGSLNVVGIEKIKTVSNMVFEESSYSICSKLFLRRSDQWELLN